MGLWQAAHRFPIYAICHLVELPYAQPPSKWHLTCFYWCGHRPKSRAIMAWCELICGASCIDASFISVAGLVQYDMHVVHCMFCWCAMATIVRLRWCC